MGDLSMVSDPTIRWEIPSGQDFPQETALLSGNGGVFVAVDWGERRVGLALSDREGRFSWPVDPFIRQSHGPFSSVKDALFVSAIRKLVVEEAVSGMIFGVPYYHLSGDPNPKAQDFLESGRYLSREIPLPVLFWDEGLSSETVRSAPFVARAPKKGKKFTKDPWMDSKSAALILESFLSSFRCRLKDRHTAMFSGKAGTYCDES
jgi:putative Holliday junction resolvase